MSSLITECSSGPWAENMVASIVLLLNWPFVDVLDFSSMTDSQYGQKPSKPNDKTKISGRDQTVFDNALPIPSIIFI